MRTPRGPFRVPEGRAVTGIVLAGGVSRRMGVAKALLRVNGDTFLERAVSRLRGICARIIVSASPELCWAGACSCHSPLDLPGLTIVRDEAPDLGPLAGIIGGLAASSDDWHVVLACDLPLVRAEVLDLLVRRAKAGECDAVVPRASGRLQPLVAAYSRRCLEPGRAALKGGKRAVAAMLDQVRVVVVEEAELREADPDLGSFFNVNTWEDYRAICGHRHDTG